MSNPQKLLAYNMTPREVIDALATGNTIIPAGNVYIKDSMPVVANNATVVDIQRLGDIPLRVGMNVYLRDVATFQDDTDITYGYALVNGKKSVYLPIIKKDTGSTLTVVDDVHKAMKTFREAVPKDVKVNFEFDESPTVMAAVESVAIEGLIGAGLTGLMILLFLRDLRSVIVVVANIPLALLGSLFGLWATGNTINIMSLGGMALAIGILVDMATVTIENIHVQMQGTDRINTAVLRGNNATAMPILLALLCILSVFVPAFIMGDPLRSLFMPLTLAVGFAMISSYLLSSTFVPVFCVALLRHSAISDPEKVGVFDRMLEGLWQSGGRSGPAAVVGGSGLSCGLCAWCWACWDCRSAPSCSRRSIRGSSCCDSGRRPGSNFELTRELAVKCLEEIEKEAKPENIAITMGYVGQVAPNFGIDNMVLFMRGPDDGQLRVALKDSSGIRLAQFRERLREGASPAVDALARRSGWRREGCPAKRRSSKSRQASFGFEPGDIVTKVMSFGSLTPIAVRIVGTDLKLVREHAEKIAKGMKQIKFLRDVEFEQTLDYPTVEVTVDREKAGLSGAKVDDVAHALVMATASTRFHSLNYWVDVKTGFDYLVQIQVPPLRMEKAEDVEILPIASVNPLVNLMIRDVATVRKGNATRRARSRHVATLRDLDRQRRGRRHGPRLGAGRQGHRRGRRAAPRRPRRADGPAPTDEGDVQGALDRAGGRGVRDLRAPDGEFPVATAGTDLRRLCPGRARGHRHHPLLHQHLAQHRVVHGLDHVSGGLGVKLGVARDVHERALEGRSILDPGGDRRRRRAATGDLDDGLRHDRRHGADGAGAGKGKPDAGPARPGGHRRPGDVDLRHLAGPPLNLRSRHRHERSHDLRRSTRATATAATMTHGSFRAGTTMARTPSLPCQKATSRTRVTSPHPHPIDTQCIPPSRSTLVHQPLYSETIDAP